jgi:hypothetical protein
MRKQLQCLEYFRGQSIQDKDPKIGEGGSLLLVPPLGLKASVGLTARLHLFARKACGEGE